MGFRVKTLKLSSKNFKKPAFTIMLLAMLSNTMFPGGVMVLSTQFLQLVAGLSPLEADLWMIPAMSGSIIGFLLSPYLAHYIRPAYLIGLGLLCSIAGLLILCLTTVGSGFATLIIGFALFNLGAGPLTTLGTGIIIRSVEPHKAGSAAAISQTSNEFGFALGVAIVGSIGTFVYHTQTAASLPLLTGLTAADAQAVRESLANAVDKVGDLPSQLGSKVLYLARNAFVEEYHTASLVSAVVMVIIAVVIVTRFNRIKADGEDAAE